MRTMMTPMVIMHYGLFASVTSQFQTTTYISYPLQRRTLPATPANSSFASMNSEQMYLRAFPTELLAEIAGFLPWNDYRRLATVSRPFHDIATRLLYRELVLYGNHALKACMSTLAFNTAMARHVKSLDILIASEYVVRLFLLAMAKLMAVYNQSRERFHMTPVLRRTFIAAFQNVAPSLTYMCLFNDTTPMVPLIKRLSFPRLNELQIMEPLHKETDRFLRLNPNLKVLGIMGTAASLPPQTGPRSKRSLKQATALCLPSLRTIDCACDTVHLLLPGSNPERLRIRCHCGSTAHVDAEDALLEVLKSSHAPLKALDVSLAPSHPEALLDTIKSNFTNLTALGFWRVSKVEGQAAVRLYPSGLTNVHNMLLGALRGSRNARSSTASPSKIVHAHKRCPDV